MRVGIFGGTFDPVHYGHLLLAETCREQCGLDHVLFLPAAIPPHKQQWRLTPAVTRLEMLRLAIIGHKAFSVSELEIRRGGVTYTVDTLTALRDQQPQDELFFLMGADSLRDLPTWREAARICSLAVPVVVRRRDTPEPDFGLLAGLVPAARLQEIRRHQAQMPLVDFSSTAIRQAVAAGRSIRYQTPRAVEMYIQTQGLYRTEASQA
ncbi:MAG: nicotinate (nicotinamide) nucleotide adenylyltransferase [Candidatus Anammoximicrobium sp.]|nr:nicotinate (nicotinamide) nucleotide adenylyltransferase [Candidatus Anammoximicrobium sp.]